jgi:hypothetical protein
VTLDQLTVFAIAVGCFCYLMGRLELLEARRRRDAERARKAAAERKD